VDPSLQPHIQHILDSILQLHSVVNFKMHTQGGLSGRGDPNSPQVVSSKDLVGSDLFFDSVKYR
jgi:hypothetical protein